MDLILWRHAEAEPSQPGLEDLERTLTPKGHKQARRMGQWLDSVLPENCRILVSPATRTVQTVAGLGRKYKIHPDLAPGADASDILKAANWPSSKEAGSGAVDDRRGQRLGDEKRRRMVVCAA
jgi:phosphohistidine phosphatase